MSLVNEIEEAANRHRNAPNRRWENWKQPDYDAYIFTESSRWPRIKAALEAAEEMAELSYDEVGHEVAANRFREANSGAEK